MKKAITKIKMSLTHNVGIKIVAVIIATLVWLMVINISDPEKTIIIYGVPVTVTDEETITDMGMVYNIESGHYVNITVSGKRSVVGKLSTSDFEARASLKELSKVNSIPIDISAKRNSLARKVTIEKQSVQTLIVDIEEVQKQNFDIEVKFGGSAAAGYVAGEYTLSKSSVNVKAPTSVLDRISKVVAECELDGASADFSKKCKLVLYDKHGRTIKNNNITLSTKKVLVSVEVSKEKEVPVEVVNVGTPATGYQVEKVELSQKTVKLVGDRNVLNTVSNIVIDKAIDISNQKKNYSKVIDLNKFVPTGVTINGNHEIKIDIEIKPLEKKTFTLKSSEIKINNKGDKSVKIKDDIKVSLQGEKEVINKISKNSISASIDVDKLDIGTSKVPVDINVPDGTTLLKDVTVSVEIS